MSEARYIVIDGPIGAGKTTLARRLAALIADPQTRARLGAAAAEAVRREFDFTHCIGAIAAAFAEDGRGAP